MLAQDVDRNAVMARANPVSFTVDGKVVPWARAGRKGGFSYTPSHVRKYQDFVKVCASQAMNGLDLIEVPVSVTAQFFLPIPSSWPAWKKEAAGWGLVCPAGRPDVDNLVKGIEDACNLVVWKDDAQVVELQATKLYGTKPRVEVNVHPIDVITSALDWKRHLQRLHHVPQPGDDLFAGAA